MSSEGTWEEGEWKLPGLTIHLVGNIAQCPEPQEPEPITSLYNRISLSGLRASAPPRPCRLGDGGGIQDGGCLFWVYHSGPGPCMRIFPGAPLLCSGNVGGLGDLPGNRRRAGRRGPPPSGGPLSEKRRCGLRPPRGTVRTRWRLRNCCPSPGTRWRTESRTAGRGERARRAPPT